MSKTLTSVPIVETGIEYPTSTGLVTFTVDDLQSMVDSQDDPAIVSPRLKLGHSDVRFNNQDGEPAFGIAQNLRTENNGNTLLCDYVGVPDWLAEVMPTAYPSRSIEGNWDVQTVTGHKWPFVVTDVALLGVVWPGITTLDDLEIALSDEGPEGVDTEMPAAAKAGVTCSVNMEDVRRSFYETVATQDSDQYWWWIRAVMLDPNEVIVDDDEGGLFRVPFSMNKKGDVSWDDPIPVAIKYVDQPVSASTAGQVIASSYSSSEFSRPHGRDIVNVDKGKLKKVLGMSADATEDDIRKTLAEKSDEEEVTGEPTTADPDQDESGSEGEESEESSESEGGVTPGTVPPGMPDAPAQPGKMSGAVLVDRETLATLQRNSNMGVQAWERQRKSDRDSYLHAAVQNGKFPPARFAHWQEAWDRDPDGIKAQIDSMPEGLIPVGQIGGAPLEEGDNALAYSPTLFPQLNKRSTGTVVQETS